MTTQSLDDSTELSVLPINRAVSLVAVVIHDGKEPPPDKMTAVIESFVAYEPELHARIDEFDVYAFAFAEGKGSVAVVFEPTEALYVTLMPLPQG